ncbi:bifunctional [glutamate--ammonia ligase]-adenylyl-L-tyrosine phosphorylase/[glutamate--ammonia-ligase] adenylyltransferase [Aliidiomarina celeris]|uniref:bifunctional [glutamate--ammonia ligase]-adenylyl-L-tyrosine phosphorylase/[glutamate--ammonia-ligase] adenylyltransferase n=1 Tax=Aliidiomarina celeris TaxID=2249428 RepID=UPI001E30DD5C|nr:bifunctional [glutamate--ammonia ligase]-adenylyl-L-tyrosine phosphorylase/[glutamate--ammonia-ligase] adenylyltransferase [Aliidiomarina celeris]
MSEFPAPPLKPTQLQPSLDTELTQWKLLCEQHNEFAELAEEARLSVQWVIELSPFVARVLLRYGIAAWQFMQNASGWSNTQLAHALDQVEREQQAQAIIRKLRNFEMARIAYWDLRGELVLSEALHAISALADGLITTALEWSHVSYAERYGQAYAENGKVLRLWCIAMGKLGGHELNFSSDIDLIFCFEQQGETRGGRKAIEHELYFTKVAQRLVKVLGEMTADGQAYRVDLRLRPFGHSGPMVTSLSAFEDYYQEQGRNWERYAMVKSRVITNNAHIQTQFAELMRPFVYRRYLDYSAIDALRKMKLLINQEARRQGVKNNVKLGIGGIREVEFVAQVFQLIRGGREVEFRTRSLRQALHAASHAGVISEADRDELLYGYAWLRKVEHTLQEINDEQTQTLPADDTNQRRVLIALGYSTWASFMSDYKRITKQVHQQFLDVIGGEAEMITAEDSDFALLWQDLIEDETAINVLAEAGVEQAELCWQRIRDFRQRLRLRSSGPRGRELLASLVPWLIEDLVAQANSEQVLMRVFDVLEQISSRTTYIELLAGNAGARKQLVFLCRESPWVAHLIARFPMLLDELIDPQQLYDLPNISEYRQQVAEYVNRFAHDDAEAQMESLRQVKQIFQLRVAAADLSDGVALMKVSDHLTALAEAMIEQVVLMAWRQLADKHGVPQGRHEGNTGFSVIGYGKLGGFELGYGSDLDLVFVCDDELEGQTDGAKPIDTQQFYLRLAQRVLHLFTTRSMNGVLYDVDMRLRPSGQSGLLVVRASTYRQYLLNDAWLWELQALVRARHVFGTANAKAQFESIRAEVLTKPRDQQEVGAEIKKMREKMREHLWKQSAEQFDIKQMPGGVADIEFITQFLALSYAHKYPHLIEYTDNIRILERAAEVRLLSARSSEQLIEIYQKLRRELHRLALAELGNLSGNSMSHERDIVVAVWQELLPN